MMIYFDTNVLVYATVNNGPKGDVCRKIIEESINKKSKIYTSSLTWDEFTYSIWKKEGKEKAIIQGENFLKIPLLKLINADALVVYKAQSLVKEYGLKPRDAIHAATAILNDIKEIATDDSDFDKIKELKRIKINA